jgi:hypothetical protein
MLLFKPFQRRLVLLVFFISLVGFVFSSCDRLCGGCSDHIQDNSISILFLDTLLRPTVTEFGPYFPDQTYFYLDNLDNSVPIRYGEWGCRNSNICSYYFDIDFNYSLFKNRDTLSLFIELKQGDIDTLLINKRRLELLFNGKPPLYEGTPYYLLKP